MPNMVLLKVCAARRSGVGWALASGVVMLAAGMIHVGCSSSERSADSESSGDMAPRPGFSREEEDENAGEAAKPPAEREVESNFQAPVATGKFVWVANPQSGRVAYIDASTFDIRVVNAGNQPTYLAAVPSQTEDSAIVLNVASADATLLRANAAAPTKTFRTHQGANAWKLSDDGRWAIAWSNWQQAPAAPKTEGFQSVTVIDLSGQVHEATLTVGYRPVAVGFGKANRAFVVTQDGVSVIDLATSPLPIVQKNVKLSDDPNSDPGSRDVTVTPDGAFALVRRDGSSQVTVINLDSGVRTEVQLEAEVTDLDIVPDGTRAIAVMRSSATMALLPLPGIAEAPTVFSNVVVTGETVGSVAVAANGRAALLYSNAVDAERVTTVDLLAATPEYRIVRLWAPILAAFPTRTGDAAVVLHDVDKLAPDAGARPGGAFSLLPLNQRLPARIVSTEAPLTSVALTHSGDRAVLAERDDKSRTFAFHVATLPSLVTKRVPLTSPPISVGIVEGARRAFVAQSHPEGRITLVDLDTEVIRTLTGFEVNARIDEQAR